MAKEFIHIENSRQEYQKKVMLEIAANKHCPFCPEHLDKYHKNPILKKGKFWTLTDNQWPYDKVKHQLLAIYNTHIEHLNEMDNEAGAELIQMFKDESVKRNVLGGGIAIRFGSNPEHGTYGNSVFHIHAHMIEPDLAKLESEESWKFSFGKGKKR